MLCGLGGLALAGPAVLQELPPKSAGHHTSITPIFRVRTGGQERFKHSAEVTQASSQEHSRPDAHTYSCRYPPQLFSQVLHLRDLRLRAKTRPRTCLPQLRAAQVPLTPSNDDSLK